MSEAKPREIYIVSPSSGRVVVSWQRPGLQRRRSRWLGLRRWPGVLAFHQGLALVEAQAMTSARDGADGSVAEDHGRRWRDMEASPEGGVARAQETCFPQCGQNFASEAKAVPQALQKSQDAGDEE